MVRPKVSARKRVAMPSVRVRFHMPAEVDLLGVSVVVMVFNFCKITRVT